MIEQKKNTEKTEGGIFRAFELFTEFLGWLQIIALPLLFGLIAGAVIYFSNPTAPRLLLGIIVAALGLVIGIIWARKRMERKRNSFVFVVSTDYY
ncbi:MAG: hypothetical protein J5I50_03760 [Chitinophagaceae bacterium]|nr:hypothetical protein [Chitinophagaceae bacterium]